MNTNALFTPLRRALVALSLSLAAAGPALAADITLITPSSHRPVPSPASRWRIGPRTTDQAHRWQSGGEDLPRRYVAGRREMYDGVTKGVADIGLGSPAYDPGVFPLTSGISTAGGLPQCHRGQPVRCGR